MPNVKTRLIFNFNWLNAEKFFLPRTMGRLKMGIFGKPTSIDQIGRIAIVSKISYHEQKISFSNLTLHDDLPNAPLNTKSLIDEMGQYTKKNWINKYNSISEMKVKLNNQYNESIANSNTNKDLSIYGGLLRKKLTNETGFFKTFYDGKRWC